MTGAENREYKRMPTARPVRFKLLEEGDPELELNGVTSDLSHGGLALTTPWRVKYGKVVKLFLDLGLGEELKIFATVAWAKDDGGQPRAGLRFVGISEAQEELIDELVERYHKGAHRRISKN